MQTLPNFRLTLGNPPFVADNTGLYQIVAEAIARQPDHLAELVQLFITLDRHGIRLEDHLDCIVEALVLEELQ